MNSQLHCDNFFKETLLFQTPIFWQSQNKYNFYKTIVLQNLYNHDFLEYKDFHGNLVSYGWSLNTKILFYYWNHPKKSLSP